MIAQIQDINDKEFSLNGVKFLKNFIAIYYPNGVRIVNAYDSRLEIVNTNYFEVSVNGSTYGNAEDLSAVLSSVLFSKVVNRVDLPSYQTLALLNSEFTDPQEHNTAVVTNDTTTSNNGSYSYYNGGWVKFADTQSTLNKNTIGTYTDPEGQGDLSSDVVELYSRASTAQSTANTAKILATLSL